MFSILPDLTPRDAHSLWYTSSRNPNQVPPHLDPSFLYASAAGTEHGLALPAASGATAPNSPQRNHNNAHNRSANQAAIIERSVLGRLRADELYMERRRQNVGNLGSTWLKPPGVGKTLFQIREERREAEEHAEAVRREIAQQELAEAAAAGAGVDPMALGIDEGAAAAGTGLEGEQIMVDEEENGEEGERDLDDEIPDADEGGFGFDGISEDEEEESEEESEESEASEEDDEEETGGLDDSPRRQRREEANRIGTMRATEDRMREMLATRGTASHRHHAGHEPGGGDSYGADDEIDEEDHQADILEEDDLLQGRSFDDGMEDDLDMDANLDDDIPEAESLGGYEHTDSEAELSSDEDEDEHEISYANGSARRRISQQPQQFGRNPAHRISSSGPYALPPYPPRQTPQQKQQQQDPRHRQYRSSLASARDAGEGSGGGGQRSSLDISGLLSRDGSSVIGSSPRMRRAH